MEINITILIFQSMKMIPREAEEFAQMYTASKWQTQVTQEMKEKEDLKKKKNTGSEVSGPGFAMHWSYVMSQNMGQRTAAEWGRPQGEPLPVGETNSHKRGQKSRASNRSVSGGCGHKGRERALSPPDRWAKFGC